MFRTNFHGPNDVWAIEVQLYADVLIRSFLLGISNEYQQGMFVRRNKKNVYLKVPLIKSYVEYWGIVFNLITSRYAMFFKITGKTF